MNETAPATATPRPGLVRRLYDWVLSWAEHPQAAWALFLLALAESSFFPVPPDVLLIALVLGASIRDAETHPREAGLSVALRSLVSRRSRPAWSFTLICSVGSVVGGVIGYGIGHFLWWTPTGEFSGLAQFFFDYVPGFTVSGYETIHGYYESYNFWIVFAAGFTPLPYKIFTISAGAFDINFPVFVLASVLSRTARFAIVAALVWMFGEWAKGFIDKYFNLLSILFVILLVGGFLVLKFFLH